MSMDRTLLANDGLVLPVVTVAFCIDLGFFSLIKISAREMHASCESEYTWRNMMDWKKLFIHPHHVSILDPE
jgi:hypothetical protein